MSKVFIVQGLRTPTGVFDGSLKSYTEQKLAAAVMKELFKRAGECHQTLDEVVIGCGKQTSVPSNIARHAALVAGLPDAAPAYTVQRQSASGMQAVANGYWLVKSGNARMVMAGGAESMSNIPREIHDARFEFSENTRIVFDPIEAQLAGAQPKEQYGALTAESVAENIVKQYGLSGEALREYAEASAEKAKARTAGEHILTLEVRKGKTKEIMECDELYPQPEPLARPADGAAVCLLAGEELVKRLNLQVCGEILSVGISAGEPSGFGWIGGEAVARALKKAGLDISQIGMVECNEMSAAQALALKSELTGLGATDLEKTFNCEGGGLITGSAWGAAGSAMLVDLLYRMNREGVSIGLAVTPAEGGQSMAMILRARV